jgi:glycosyltransferase involved in cell wall biosynthesis
LIVKIVIKAASVKMGGALTYICDFLLHATNLEPRLELVVVLPEETISKLPAQPKNVRLVPVPTSSMTALGRVWWEEITLRRLIRRESPDFVYATGNFGMFRCPAPQIVLIECSVFFSDLYEKRFLPAHSFPSRMAFKLRRWLICRSAQWANIVMTPTQATLEELRRFAAVPPPKALVNPYGVEGLNGHPQSNGRMADGDAADKPMRLLYVSLYCEHKDLTTLLKAMPLLNQSGDGRFTLVTTANPAWAVARGTVMQRGDLQLLKRPEISDALKVVGPLEKEETQKLYRDADIFVFPSLTESFGFPLVEAMANGLPIVAADTPVNREICGEAALYFRPLDPEDLAEKVVLLGRNQALREKLGAMGRSRAATCFRWEDHVERLLRAFGLRAGAAVQQHEVCGEVQGCPN